MGTKRKAAITGATGYLGGILCDRLREAGYEVVPLVRPSHVEQENARAFVLGAAFAPDELADIDLFVHCAYDLKLADERAIWRVNVEGSRRVLEAAGAAGVRRIITLSSMSAYDGTSQLYGRAKLAIEQMTSEVRGVIVRPGLVWGERPGGMVGALRKLTHLPIVPVVGGSARQYLVHEADFADAIATFADAPIPPTLPIGLAYAESVPFREVLEILARQEGRSPRFIGVPWQAAALPLRVAERLRVPVPFRSDSLLGLLHPAPFVPGYSTLDPFGIKLRAFG